MQCSFEAKRFEISSDRISYAMLFELSLVLFAPQSGVPLFEVDGHAAGHGLGTCLAAVGDLNGDGVSELMGGGNRYGSPAGPVLVDGASGATLKVFTQPTFGEVVAAAGDVNGDGTPDLIVGDIFAPSTALGAGKAWVYSGQAPYALLYSYSGTAADQYFGGGATGLGDVNGDGFGDFAIGSWGAFATLPFSGKVEVFSGADGSLLDTIDGTFDHGYFGEEVERVPDVDGDGVDELLVGAFGESALGYNTGAAYLYSGATRQLIWMKAGPAYNSRMGDELAGVGDLNGDGAGEVIASARFNAGNGSVFVLDGTSGATLFEFYGYDPDEVFGAGVAGAPDVNGDGIDDILIGSDAFYEPGGYTGFARVYSGADGWLLRDYRTGVETERFGRAVAGLGDVNGDGRGDVAVGAADADTGAGSGAGKLYVFSGMSDGLALEVVDFFAGSTTAQARVSGCQPGSSVIFAWSFQGPGPTGTPLGLADLTPPIQQAPPVAVNAQGRASLNIGVINPSAQGMTVWAQAAELYATGGGRLSLGLEMRVQ